MTTAENVAEGAIAANNLTVTTPPTWSSVSADLAPALKFTVLAVGLLAVRF